MSKGRGRGRGRGRDEAIRQRHVLVRTRGHTAPEGFPKSHISITKELSQACQGLNGIRLTQSKEPA